MTPIPTRDRGRLRRVLTVLVGAAALLSACQKGEAPPSVSVEEAKQITAEFGQHRAFKPPPRSIGDVVAMLSDFSATESPVRTRLTQMADAAAPASATATFYAQRAEAARLLGRHRQGLRDASTSLSLSPNANYFAHTTLAAIYEQLGDFHRAVKHGAIAVDAIQTAGNEIAGTGTFAIALSNIGDFDGAASALSRSRSALSDTVSWTRGREWIPFLKAFVSMVEGHVAHQKGDYEAAETSLREAIVSFDRDSTGAAVDSTGSFHEFSLVFRRRLASSYARRLLGETLSRQDRPVEAEALAREALALQARHFGRDSALTAEGLEALSIVLSEQGRFADAIAIAEVAIAIYERMGVEEPSVSLALARQLRGDALVGRSMWREAAETYEVMMKGLESDAAGLERLLQSDLTWALALMRADALAETEVRLRATHATHSANLGASHPRIAEVKALLATALMRQGLDGEALGHFQEAVPILIGRSRNNADEDGIAVLRDIRTHFALEAYIALLETLQGSAPADFDPVAEAFRVADFTRGRTVQRAVASSAARAFVRDPQLADLVRREQDARKRISALYGVLANAAGNAGEAKSASILQSLRADIERLRQARASLLAEIEAQSPRYSALVDPRPATIADARATLMPGEAVLAFYVSEYTTFVWAVGEDGEVAFASVDLGDVALTKVVNRLRRVLEPEASTLGDIPEFRVGLAHELYSRLLEPVRSGWGGAEHVIVVPHGPLGYLPLGVLPTALVKPEPAVVPLFSSYRDVPWLARRHTFTVVPSVAALKSLRELPSGNPGRRPFVGFGDPWFSTNQAAAAVRGSETKVASAMGADVRGLPVALRALPDTRAVDSAELAQLPRLPETADELRSIARALGSDPVDSVFTGADASETRARSGTLSGVSVIAFATHGLVPGDLNGLAQPALALSSPNLTGETDTDGVLTMGEILPLRLDADWVVLSACNTAAADGAGAEAVSGLGRAFFYAGSRALLVSNWPVHSDATKELTTRLFRLRAEQGLSRAEALRHAMVSLIDDPGYRDAGGREVFSYAHPIFWAPFSLVGDGGAAAALTN